MPGSTPTKVPTKQPTKPHIKVVGCRAMAKPPIRASKASMGYPIEKRENVEAECSELSVKRLRPASN
jgi:hypothetical protein